jgi:hypothetical protein
MKRKEIQESIGMLREEWRRTRKERLLHRDELLSQGLGIAAVRNDRLYRELRRRQRGFAVSMLHLERTMNRKRAREKEE